MPISRNGQGRFFARKSAVKRRPIRWSHVEHHPGASGEVVSLVDGSRRLRHGRKPRLSVWLPQQPIASPR